MEWNQGYVVRQRRVAILRPVSSVCVHRWINEYDNYKISFVAWVRNLPIDAFWLVFGLLVEVLQMTYASDINWCISRDFSEASSLNIGRKFDFVLEKTKQSKTCKNLMQSSFKFSESFSDLHGHLTKY